MSVNHGPQDLVPLSRAGLTPPAVAAAVAVAREHGLRPAETVVLAERSNVLVHLRPAPVVARVAATTALLRPDALSWFAREVAVSGFLAGRGVGVVPPSGELPPGPHEHQGLAVSFWTYVPRGPVHVPSAAEAGRALRELHRALRGFPDELPYLAPFLIEAPRLLDGLERAGELPAADLVRLREAHERLAARLGDRPRPVQALHGDAHLRNLLATAGGLLWSDFEDTCAGPVEWDLACFCLQTPWGREAALAAYGGDAPGLEELAPWIAARELQGLIWVLAMSRRLPELRPRADQILAGWRAGEGAV